ncbi:MAG: AI-2E family transporter [Deltaproteobacteria bacterium]|nr:AI-2E family transporter [Deltaproteobacteria bacterium]
MTDIVKFRIVSALLLISFLYLLYALKSITIPIIIAVIIAYLLDPLIDKLETYKISRSIAIIILISVTVTLATLLLLLLVPAIEAEMRALIMKLPAYAETIKTTAIPFFENLASKLLPAESFNMNSILAEGENLLKSVPLDIWKSILAGMSSTLKSTFSLVVSIIGTMIIPLYLYYILKEFDHMKEKVITLIPPRNRDFIIARFKDTDEILSAFIRGQMIVCLILGIIYSAGLGIIGLDLALVIGLLSGAAFIIPYLGSIISFGTAAIFAYLQFHDFTPVIYVAILYGFAQIVEGTLLTPKIVGDKVGLHPLAVIIAVITAGELFGFLGILIAVPGVAILKIFVLSAIESYKESSYYKNA